MSPGKVWDREKVICFCFLMAMLFSASLNRWTSETWMSLLWIIYICVMRTRQALPQFCGHSLFTPALPMSIHTHVRYHQGTGTHRSHVHTNTLDGRTQLHNAVLHASQMPLSGHSYGQHTATLSTHSGLSTVFGTQLLKTSGLFRTTRNWLSTQNIRRCHRCSSAFTLQRNLH